MSLPENVITLTRVGGKPLWVNTRHIVAVKESDDERSSATSVVYTTDGNAWAVEEETCEVITMWEGIE